MLGTNLTRSGWIQRELDLFFPIKVLAGEGHLQIPVHSALHSLYDVPGVGGEAGGDHALPYVLRVGERQVL